MTEYLFVDETKAGRYIMVASVHGGGELEAARRVVRGLTLPGQTRIHMRKERDARRRAIVAALCAAQLSTVVFDVGRYGDELVARRTTLSLLVRRARSTPQTVVTLERDDSLVRWDRQVLYELSRAAGLGERLTYRHLAARSEPLLGIADAVAWCWAKGGDWRRRVEPIVVDVRRP